MRLYIYTDGLKMGKEVGCTRVLFQEDDKVSISANPESGKIFGTFIFVQISGGRIWGWICQIIWISTNYLYQRPNAYSISLQSTAVTRGS